MAPKTRAEVQIARTGRSPSTRRIHPRKNHSSGMPWRKKAIDSAITISAQRGTAMVDSRGGAHRAAPARGRPGP